MARPGLRNHPKFLMLVRMLRMPAPHVLGHLEFLWSVAYENGDPLIGTADHIELACGWTGDPGVLFTALLNCGGTGRAGFIEPSESGVVMDVTDALQYRVHDLFDHAPNYVSSRADHEMERSAEKVCECCCYAYRSSEKHSKFCSNRCRQKHYRNALRGITDVLRTGVTNVTERYEPPAPAPAPINKYNTSAKVADVGKVLALDLSEERPKKDKKKAPSTEHAKLRTYFCERWKSLNGSDYPWNFGRDDAHASRILKHFANDLGKAQDLIDRYLDDGDAWYADKGHQLGLLVSGLAKFVALPKIASGNGFIRAECTEEIQEIAQPTVILKDT
jgi:hypothetical protein